jgi:hypothetical protein
MNSNNNKKIFRLEKTKGEGALKFILKNGMLFTILFGCFVSLISIPPVTNFLLLLLFAITGVLWATCMWFITNWQYNKITYLITSLYIAVGLYKIFSPPRYHDFTFVFLTLPSSYVGFVLMNIYDINYEKYEILINIIILLINSTIVILICIIITKIRRKIHITSQSSSP